MTDDLHAALAAAVKRRDHAIAGIARWTAQKAEAETQIAEIGGMLAKPANATGINVTVPSDAGIFYTAQ
jgi:hypothetical protein